MNTKPQSILLVEDNEDHAELVFKALEDTEAIKIIWTKSIAEARKIIDAEVPNLILSDYRLPDGDGIEFLGEEKNHLKFPIILMTSFDNESLAVDAIKAGVMDYIVKSPDAFTNIPVTIKRVLREWKHLTARKQAEKALEESEEKYKNLIENIPDWVWEIGLDGNYTYSSGKVLELTGYHQEEVIGASPYDFISRDNKSFSFTEEHQSKILEVCFTHKNGRQVFIESRISPLYNTEGVFKGFIGTNRDITERKKANERLYSLSVHDSLTGTYNRNYFEEKIPYFQSLEKSSLSIIVFDLDGLKLINDTIGHSMGDKYLIAAGNIIRDAFQAGSIVSRIGGDEFAVLVLDATEDQIKQYCKNVETEIDRYNKVNQFIPLSISYGYVFNDEKNIDIYEMLKEADNWMYRQKLHRHQSTKSEVVQTMKNMLEARDFITEGHASRMGELAAKLAIAIGIPEKDIADIHLLCEFHDIGKVGIPDSILFKPSNLADDEYEIMKHHSEIGHRIAESSVDLLPIADGILKHHERWDGRGYPFGLKENEIPIQCRILSIVDAYDAMTNDRPYRKAMTKGAALRELKRCSGTQFDPLLVEKFIGLMDA